MTIKQDPITKLWCREDGAVLMPPSRRGGMRYRWTFGCKLPSGYRYIACRSKHYYVHQIICRAFHGLPPEGKPSVDHINRIRDDNRPCNLHWVDHKENADNQADVGESVEKYGVRACDDKQAYMKTYYAANREERKAYMKTYYATHHVKNKKEASK